MTHLPLPGPNLGAQIGCPNLGAGGWGAAGRRGERRATSSQQGARAEFKCGYYPRDRTRPCPQNSGTTV